MELSNYREKIDQLDDKIFELFTERMELSADIAKHKQDNGIGVLHKTREREILTRLSGKASGELEGYTRILYTTLFDLSRSYQNRLITGESELSKSIRDAINNSPAVFPSKGVVACQGVEGAYSQIACDKLFPFADIMYFKRFEGVFQAVQNGLCQFGILPIENSSHGTVDEVYDLMRNYKFHIIKRLKLHISSSLLVKKGTKLSDIKEIVSHEQAIGQCSEFLNKLKDVKITICENTAAAAKLVSESDRRDIAAISSSSCAKLYNLSVLDEKIQNSDNNYTRFICISKDMLIFPGADKISLMLSVAHTPGSLYSLISKFSALGLNLTKIESRPIPGTDFEFMFYFDMDAAIASPEVISLISELSSSPELFVFLGSYSEI